MKLRPHVKARPVNPFFLGACLLLGLAGSARASAPRWDLNDVSILLPLPRTATEFAATFRAATPSDRGHSGIDNLIPTGIYDELIASFDPADRDALRPLYAKWMAVSFRIDPCFREHFPDACQKEIRVAWQPVDLAAGGAATTAEDSALHTFYPISDSEWPRVLKDLASLKTMPTAGLALGVHPGFRKEGLTGTFARRFRMKLKPWIAQSRLRTLSVTLPSDRGRKRVFKRFSVFERTAVLRLNPMWISYSSELEIRYGNASATGDSTREFSEAAPATLRPLSTSDDLRALLRDSRAARRDRRELVRFAEIQRRAIDPTKHASLTIDCLSCHATGAVGAWLAANLTVGEKAEISEPEFKNPGVYNLTNLSTNPNSLARMRAFGFAGSEVQILDRVIHESATVADRLNREKAL